MCWHKPAEGRFGICVSGLIMLGSAVSPAPALTLTRSGDKLLIDGAPARLVGYGCYGMVAEQAFDYQQYLNTIADTYGLNFCRIWVNYHWCNDLTPFAGNRSSKYDLLSQNNTFYNRLRNFVSYADSKGVVVQVCVFDGCALVNSTNRWPYFPYNTNMNLQSYLTSPSQFDDLGTTWWNNVNVPLIDRVVDELGDFGNVIYETMNEPDSHGVDNGSVTFNPAVVDRLYERLQLPQYTGSKVISVNPEAGSLHNWAMASSKVDLIAKHVHDPAGADNYNSQGKAIIISNDGDLSQQTAEFGGLSQSERIARINQFLHYTFNTGAAHGHNHFECLDKGIYGSSWTSLDYNPRVSNLNSGIMSALSAYVVENPACDPGQDVTVDLGTNDAGNCIVRLENTDGDTTPADIGGRNCRRNLDPGGSPADLYMYFGLNDGYAFQGSRPDVYITIDYYDTGSGSLELQYDSSDFGIAHEGAYKSGGSVPLGGTNAWEQHTFHVTDAYFGNRQNAGADFRIAKLGPAQHFYLDVVSVSEDPPGPQSPVADLDADPTAGDPPLTVNFDASGSYDPDGTIVGYEWDFTSDGTIDDTGVTASHQYTGVGEYTATLIVTDNDGLTGTDTARISTTGQCTVSITNLNRYVVANLSIGSQYYTDRTYTITSMPSYLQGQQGIKTANDDKEETSETWITFNTDHRADVYVAYDQRASSPPNWMSGYVNTGDTIGVSDAEHAYARLYRKTFSAGGIVLGANMASGASGAESNYFVLIVANCEPVAPPTITQHPQPQSLCAGGTATFSVSAAGEGLLTYQWQKNGADLSNGGDISGATTDTLRIANVEQADQGNYRCVVSNDGGSTTSNPAGLTVQVCPTDGMVVLTVSSMVPAGSDLTGSQPLQSVTIGGQVYNDLTGVTAVELDGNFNDGYANGLGSVPTEQALQGLELSRSVLGLAAPGEKVRAYFPSAVEPGQTDAPEIIVLEWANSKDDFQVQLLTNAPGQSVSIAATVQVLSSDYVQTSTSISTAGVGTQAVGGVGIDLDDVPGGVSGIRGVQMPAEDGLGGTTGLDPCVAAAVNPLEPPVITQQPQPQTVDLGDTATFTVTATGEGTLTYQWQKNGIDLSNGGDISGATSTTLQIATAQEADEGSYRCIVSNQGGSTTSNAASLTVNMGVSCDFDGDGDVDQEDFGHLQACYSGSGTSQTDPLCQDALLDSDEDVDQDDFGIFHGCMGGANNPPGC